MRRPLKLSSLATLQVELDEYKFEIRGLTREEAIMFRQELRDITNLPVEEQDDALLELEEQLLNTCISDEKARELVKKASHQTYRTIINAILELSGLTPEQEKN